MSQAQLECQRPGRELRSSGHALLDKLTILRGVVQGRLWHPEMLMSCDPSETLRGRLEGRTTHIALSLTLQRQEVISAYTQRQFIPVNLGLRCAIRDRKRPRRATKSFAILAFRSGPELQLLAIR
jgi:hypothetical protein